MAVATLPEEISYPLGFPLEEARFLERPNRFTSIVQRHNGEVVYAHVADPGRLRELLLPGARVLVRDHGDKPSRKFRYSLDMVYHPNGNLVSVNSQLPNRLIAHLLEAGKLPGFKGYRLAQREFTYGHSRMDFRLTSPAGTPCLLEVKGCSLVEDGHALFPDAPSVRATRHIEHLTHALAEGYEAKILFVIQRGDAVRFSPHQERDPALAQALKIALKAGVEALAYAFELTPTHCVFIREVPIVLPEAV